MTQPDANRHFLDMFSDPEAVARYAEGPRQYVPGLEALHRMTAILLAERAPGDAEVLVLGAGGGLELKALADAQPGWRFTGVDPSAQMLSLAAQTLGSQRDRAQLVEGYVGDAPPGPFDAATCLLTLHFLDVDERVRTLGLMRRRLKPGAPLVVAHSSFSQSEPMRSAWLARYAAYAIASGANPVEVEQARSAVAASLALLAPEQDEDCLRAAGFSGIAQFYSAFTWRGWVAYAGDGGYEK